MKETVFGEKGIYTVFAGVEGEQERLVGKFKDLSLAKVIAGRERFKLFKQTGIPSWSKIFSNNGLPVHSVDLTGCGETE